MLYRATPVPYDWVPAGTAHKETSERTPKLVDFKVPK